MFATIRAPNFYLQAALRHQPALQNQPVALLDDGQSKAIILQLNRAAEEAGVVAGMTASQGMARYLALVIKTRQPPQEKLLNEILLQHAASLAPYVEATAPGVCTVQFTDPRNLSAKVRHIIEQLAESEITVQAGIAATPDVSFLAAHLARPVLQIDDPQQFLGPLSLETLLFA
jgi:impB/mucB/samB family